MKQIYISISSRPAYLSSDLINSYFSMHYNTMVVSNFEPQVLMVLYTFI